MASIINFPLIETVTLGEFQNNPALPDYKPQPTVDFANPGTIPFDKVSVDSVDSEMTIFSNAQDAATGNADYIQQATDYLNAGISSGNDGVLLEFLRRKNQGSR